MFFLFIVLAGAILFVKRSGEQLHNFGYLLPTSTFLQYVENCHGDVYKNMHHMYYAYPMSLFICYHVVCCLTYWMVLVVLVPMRFVIEVIWMYDPDELSTAAVTLLYLETVYKMFLLFLNIFVSFATFMTFVFVNIALDWLIKGWNGGSAWIEFS